MVAEVVRYALRHHRRQQRLGAPIYRDRARDMRDATLGPAYSHRLGAGARTGDSMAPSSSGLGIGVNLVVTMTAILGFLSRFN